MQDCTNDSLHTRMGKSHARVGGLLATPHTHKVVDTILKRLKITDGDPRQGVTAPDQMTLEDSHHDRRWGRAADITVWMKLTDMEDKTKKIRLCTIQRVHVAHSV